MYHLQPYLHPPLRLWFQYLFKQKIFFHTEIVTLKLVSQRAIALHLFNHKH